MDPNHDLGRPPAGGVGKSGDDPDAGWADGGSGADGSLDVSQVGPNTGSGADRGPTPAITHAGTHGSEASSLSLSPKVVLFWRLPWVILTTILVIGCIVGSVASDVITGWLIAAAVFAAVGVAGATVLPRARYRRWRYWVTDETIELRHGLVFKAESSIPHFRVQHIDVRQGPLQRSAGIVELVISTASAATDATLPGLQPERADAIRRAVLARAEADDAV